MDETLDVAFARGIALVPVGRDSRPEALRIYTEHVETDVFPLLVTPGSPLLENVPAVNAAAFSIFPGGTFPGRAQMAAGVKHIHQVPAGRLLVIVEFAHLLGAYQFNSVVTTLRKAAGAYFSSRTRMIVLFDERNPVPGQFYEAACLGRDWFSSRALLVTPVPPAPGAMVEDEDEDEAMVELRRRVCAVSGGVWPSDPWVAGMISAISRRRHSGGFGGRVVVSATGHGLAAAVNGIAAAFAGSAVETLKLGFRMATQSGRERLVIIKLPFSPLLRGAPEFFSTILATTVDSVPLQTVGARPKHVVVPRGTCLWWEGRLDPVEVVDEGSEDRQTGVHYMAPDAVSSLGDVANWLVCWAPGGLFGDTTGPVEVRVPMFYGDPAHALVRAVGLSTRPAREIDGGDSAVLGFVIGFNMLEPSVPARVPTRAVIVAPEAFGEDQLSVVLDMCTGPVAALTTAPVEGARLFLNFASPYGTGPARRGPDSSLAHIRALVPRSRSMRVGSWH